MTKYIIASGQSNMPGRGLGGLWSFPSNLKVWNNRNERADTTQLGTGTIVPVIQTDPFYTATAANCLGVQAAGFYARTTTEAVRLTMSAKGGQPISAWHDGTTQGAQLTRLLAVVDATGKSTPFDAFLWHQGESGITVAGWDAMIDVLKTANVLGSSTPIIMGTVAPGYTASNAVIEEIAAADSNIRLARVGGFEKEQDGVHLTGDALVRAGMVYASELVLAGV